MFVSNLSYDVWYKKYKAPNETKPEETIERLVDEIYRIECKYPNPLTKNTIRDCLEDFNLIVLGGSCINGIGVDTPTSLSNCFVIDGAKDSYGGIYKTDEEQAQLMKRRGGVGHDLSNIRPNKAEVNNSANTSTGVVPIMHRYSNSTKEVAQDGRRGALMLTLHINHPDILDFITAKQGEFAISGANVSLKITNKFIKAINDKQQYWITSFPIDAEIPKDEVINSWKEEELIKQGNIYYKKIRLDKILDLMAHNIWLGGDPGLLLWDNILESSPLKNYDDTWRETCTNPCGTIK